MNVKWGGGMKKMKGAYLGVIWVGEHGGVVRIWNGVVEGGVRGCAVGWGV